MVRTASRLEWTSGPSVWQRSESMSEERGDGEHYEGSYPAPVSTARQMMDGAPPGC